MSSLSIAALAGALLGMLLVFTLALTRGQRAYANRMLAACILVSTSYLLALVAIHSPDLDGLSFLRAGGLVIFLYGPTLYLYVRSLTDANFELGSAQLLHGLPFLLVLLDQFGLFGQLADGRGRLVYANTELLSVVYYSLVVAYLLASVRLMLRFRERTLENYSSIEGRELRWLSILLGIAFMFAVFGWGFAFGRWAFSAQLWPMRVWSIGMMVAINYLIAFFAMTRPVLFSPPAAEKTFARYETSSLTAEQAAGIWERLEALMQSEQLYLQNQLKIGELAEALAIPPNHLSQTINQQGDCSFFAYVNRYRVEAARQLLRESEPGARTMLDIALSAGFNSESAFYKQFRQQVGVTPRQFQLQK